MNIYHYIKNTISHAWYDFRCRCQRFKRGYAYSDVWDIDVWFMRTVKPMLVHLRDHGMSHPIEFKDRNEWVAVLDEMIDCLDSMDEDYVMKFLGFGEIDDYKRMTRDDWDRIYTMMAEIYDLEYDDHKLTCTVYNYANQATKKIACIVQ